MGKIQVCFILADVAMGGQAETSRKKLSSVVRKPILKGLFLSLLLAFPSFADHAGVPNPAAPSERAMVMAAGMVPIEGAINPEKLREIGFERIGKTDYWRKGDLFLKKKGERWELFFNHVASAGIGEVVGFRFVKNEDGEEELVIQKRSGETTTVDFARNSYSDVKMAASLFEKKLGDSPAEDLKALGFKARENDPGTLTRTIIADGYELKLIALVENGKVLALLHEGFSVIGPAKLIGMKKADSGDRGGDEIYFQDDNFTFAAHTKGDAYNPYPIRIDRVNRELEGKNIGILPVKPVKEASGFIVGGVNDSDVIKKLDSINGSSIETLEGRMRPGAYSQMGFLGEDESLRDVLAKDNAFVRSKGKTHQDLAHPLNYFESLRLQGYVPRSGEAVYRGIPFSVSTEEWKGHQDSPFRDGTLTAMDQTVVNLQDGSSIRYSPLVGKMIDRYGFYEGEGTSYRVDPREILNTFGMDPKYREHLETDPVAAMVKDPKTPVILRSPDQLNRFITLVSLGKLSADGNYTFEVGEFKTLRAIGDLIARDGRYAALANHLKIGKIPPQTLGLMEASHLVSGAHKIPPSILEPLFKAVSAVEGSQIPKNAGYSWKFAVEELFKQAAAQGVQGDLARDVLSKIDFSKVPLDEMIDAAKKVGTDPKQMKVLDSHAPAFLSRWREQVESRRGLLSSAGVEIPKSLGVKELLDSVDSLESVTAQINGSRAYIKSLGRIEATSEDTATLLKVLSKTEKDPVYKPSEAELAALKHLKIDPELVPFAIAANKRRDASSRVAGFYNGLATQQKEVQATLEKFPVLDQEGRALAVMVLKGEQLNSRLSNLSGRFIDELGKLKTGTKQDVVDSFLKSGHPELFPLLKSKYFTVEVSVDSYRPVMVSLNEEEVRKLPFTDAGTGKARQFKVGEISVSVPEYGTAFFIQKGDKTFPAQSRPYTGLEIKDGR